jgi:NAD(P)-dependent dehydrogenase (short-subunit alcohol dehydrogenase family)
MVVLMGASGGTGREAALRFAKKRHEDRNRGSERSGNAFPRGRESWAEGGDANYVVAEVTDFDQVKAVADRAAEEYGRLDT